MTALNQHNAKHADQPLCPCCADRAEVRPEQVAPGLWTCAGCRGELVGEPCFTVGTPDETKGSPDGEHYHFRQGDGRIHDKAQASA